MPTSDIFISINGKTTFLANINGEASIQDHIGGKNSITACGSWWAGSGEYFYAAQSANGIIIYKGWADEGQENSDYHWKKFKEITK